MTNADQPESEGYPFSIIEMKESDSGATTYGNAFNKSSVEAEMPIPSLSARVDKKGR